MNVINLFKHWRQDVRLFFCFVLTILIGVARFYTGTEYALSLFYLFPITLVAWHSGFMSGMIMSGAGACSWLVADLALMDSFSTPWIPFINETFRLVVFIFMAYLVSELKNAYVAQERLARTDSLTGMLNRRAFVEEMEAELGKIKRYGYVVSVIYIDVDDFKDVNDQLGHAGGDRLLCAISGIIQSNIRMIDRAGRLGGDEFGLLLPQTGCEAAYLVATKIKRKLLNINWVGTWHPSVSMGVVTYECLPDSVHEMIKQADTLMYAAKKNGKNTINRRVMKSS